jgi:Mg-chelatase subunit ChlD
MSDGSSTKLDKLGFVHLTLKALLQNLQEKDRLALVKFNKMGERLTSLMGNTEFNRNIFRKRVEELHAGGGTSIVSGMREAFRILKGRRQSNPVTSIFLLTDGMEKNADVEIKQLLKEMDMENDNFTIHTFGFGSDH